MSSLVLITDVTSFTSAYIIKKLLEEGYQIRGVVSSLQEEDAKINQIRNLCPGAKYEVEFIESDLSQEEALESAIQEVQYVIHVIKPAAPQPASQPDQAPVQPAVQIVQNVLRASIRSKTVRRVILSSSYQTVTANPTISSDKVYTEADWADAETTVDPLVRSLILAEKAAWNFVQELTDDDKIELCSINPSLPLGPPLLDAHQDVVKLLLDRALSGCPRVCYSLVDVRDVAEAHFKALALDSVVGNRHIIHASNLWMKDIALILSREFKPQGYNIHTTSLPKVCLWGLSLFNKPAKSFLPIVGKQNQLDNTRMKDVLGINPRDVKDTILEEARVLIEQGLVKKSKRSKVKEGASAETADQVGVAGPEHADEAQDNEDKEGDEDNKVEVDQEGKENKIEVGGGDEDTEKKTEEAAVSQ